MIKRTINTVAAILIVLGIYVLVVKAGWLPSPSMIFKPAPVLIDQTPILINEIRQVSQLVSITAFDEVVVSTVKPAPVGSARQLLHLVTPTAGLALDHLVLVVKGTVQVGTDLGGLSDQQVFASGDSVSLTLPAAKILQVTANPSGTETFIEEGIWLPAEVNTLKLKAIEQLKARAIEKGLLHKADVQSLQVMQHFLKALGYTRVRVVTSQ
ncbi:DUF4230 domain-containing protein [Flavihumibacter profundi]|jgi:hypothetical protein|uniref:DUF4230 domain-containing protein n=1 Tax=Flavihumibacter profundi TaxID=2716883 RepID=UPI001CC4457C|nr:DUF4230 domain-containing protein [Flavihumibacter profundi]MBZ5855570.1 DUF4230 domain-containing protein [Flavihumibacter profundi]